MKLGIIIPAYNEEKRIPRTLDRYGDFFEKLKEHGKIDDFEILIVINNTTDKTEDVVKSYAKKYREIKCINLKQKGKGFAITQGFKEQLKRDLDLIGFVDADLSTPPEEYYKLVQNMRGYDGAIASRYVPGAKVRPNQNFTRRAVSRLGNFVIRVLFLFPYRDTQCGAKVFRRDVIEKIVSELKSTQWAYDVELLYEVRKNRFRVKEIPTSWADQKESGLNIKKASLQVFLAVLQLRIINSKFRRLLHPFKPIIRWLWRKTK